MFPPSTIATIVNVALDQDLPPAALLALVEVESAGRVFAIVAGQEKPLIRFEGHYFDRRLSAGKRKQARLAGLADPRAGVIANPASQTARWALFKRASAIDAEAAAESTSWGVGQVMGAHWHALGYPSVAALAEDAQTGLEGQLRLMLGFIANAGLKPHLKSGNWARVARVYNGPAYAKNRYDHRMRQAESRWQKHLNSRLAGTNRSAASDVLTKGAKGEAVAELQRALVAAGFSVVVDGDFGPRTLAALRQFQSTHQVPVTGTLDAATSKMLIHNNGLAAAISRLWTMICRWLRSAP
jgi:hypothetical protein